MSMPLRRSSTTWHRKLYFHGHPINRKEAREELELNVIENPSSDLEIAIWKLYEDFEKELDNRIPFDPMGAVLSAAPPPVPTNPSEPKACIVLPGVSAEMDLKIFMVESSTLSSCYRQKMRFVVSGNGDKLEPLIRSETLVQEWVTTPAP